MTRADLAAMISQTIRANSLEIPGPDYPDYLAAAIIEKLPDALWEALKLQCCATKPADQDKVRTIVQVSRADIVAAIKGHDDV